MNDQMIKKIIESNNEPSPEFVFENPLLERDVAEALSKSFMRILNLTQENPQVSNLRVSVLENIRKLCQTQPENHLNFDDNAMSLLSEIYINKVKDSERTITSYTDKELDAFLIQNLKEMEIDSRYKPPLSPEIVQAFKNLNQNSVNDGTLFKDIIHWDNRDSRNICILKELWSDENPMSEDISIKLKPEFEQLFLEICHNILTGNVADIDEIFILNSPLRNMINRSANSPNSFQISIGILHYIFVKTNFNKQIQIFIQKFVERVKIACPQVTFSVLYPSHLMPIVVLLDAQVELFLDNPIGKVYLDEGLNYLTKLHSKCENDFIMLLSHFPQWYDLYFKNVES